MPRELLTEESYQSLYRPYPVELNVPSAEVVTYTIPRPVSAEIAVVDAVTGCGVKEVEVAVPHLWSGTSVACPGSVWRGWVDATAGVLRVSSSGYQRQDVPFAVDGEGGFAERVDLWPSGGTEIVVVPVGSGDAQPGELPEEVVLIGRVVGHENVVWQDRLELVDGKARVHIGHGGPLELSLVVLSAGPRKFWFSPARRMWSGEVEVIFQAAVESFK
jgi:hypothetical protein